MEGGLFLNVVIGEGAAVFELLAGKDESLLIWGDTFLVLNFGFDVLNAVAGLDIKSNRLTGQGLNENLHIYLSNNNSSHSLSFNTRFH